MTVAILALQGAFAEHGQMLDKLGADHFEIRQKKDLEKEFDALILPGGESTVMGKLLHDLDLYESIRDKILEGMPVFGTCAGLILLAKDIEEESTHLATMDIRVKRNAYGRQLGSFYTEDEFRGIGEIPMTFIRAPYIAEVFGEAEVLARVDGKIVAARQNNQLVTAFHPELSDDLKVHQYFLNMIS
ncbi:pyridoxal 5'-phosphate synthase glutaminase subunit PdxT [Blautia obeum]|uniref:pyridoxal 5'-phosphate synthase glutaminase subunit PdxT n=1 Tax=Blautia obeum TaxID=40520 RepID=UPI002A87AE80|nr:pyridoxal 5'-phosphate synthase glutaminase subunit PdxT [Lachnospiraceae bacterium]MDY4207549.1 pyridoxal 5'-phosphate synthase glutaminase subunit PdxT [Lachnospiraceae bacterium]